MDWQLAINRNRDALLRIVAALCALAGLGEGETLETLSRHLRNRLYRILSPAESAARRLIVMVARGIESAGAPLSPGGRESDFDGLAEPSATAKRQKSQERGNSSLSLPLFDPLKRFDARRKTSKSFPRISFVGLTEPYPLPPIPTPNDPVSAERLGRRLVALKRALDDLDGQAKRYARWQVRREQYRVKRSSILRPGWPPGYRKKPVHPVDEVLADCHSLALLALNPPDT